MPNTAVIFDLDGTLLDSLQDIADSANATLQGFGFPVHSIDSYREYVGDGIRGLARKTMPAGSVSDELIETFVGRYREAYESRWDANTRPFTGVPELLDELVQRDIPIAVLSNKRDEFTKKCVEKLLSRWTFSIIRGELPGVALKPDPAALLSIAGDLGVDASKCFYVGDSEIDIEVSKRAGMFDVGVEWGFRSRAVLEEAGARVIIQKPAELLEVIFAKDVKRIP